MEVEGRSLRQHNVPYYAGSESPADGTPRKRRNKIVNRRQRLKRMAEPLPQNPRLLKLWMASARTAFDCEPEDYLGAIAELLFLTICTSFFITYVFKYEQLDDNPIKNMVGYNNPCAFWDAPPALYVAALMFCPMVHLAFRYANLDSARARLSMQHSGQPTWTQRFFRTLNFVYAFSQVLLMGIFIVTPFHAEEHAKEHAINGTMTREDLHWHMRVHSFCFLQYVPILGLTMAANYIEGFLSGDPKMKPSALAWIVLLFYFVATAAESVCATYAIFWYEGTYMLQDRELEGNYKIPPHIMMTIDYCWFFSLPLAGAMSPRAPNLHYSFELEDEEGGAKGVDNVPIDEQQELQDSDFSSDQTCIWWWFGIMTLTPAVMLILVFCISKEYHTRVMLGALAVLLPLVSFGILCTPVSTSADPNPFYSGLCGFQINGANYSFLNYFCKLLKFGKLAAVGDFRPSYRKWFEEHATEDPTVGEGYGDKTLMYYSWKDCVEKLQQLGNNISANRVKRESELALTVLNNVMWPEAGKFALGFDADQHGLVRPFLAKMFDLGENTSWTLQSLRSQFKVMFAQMKEVDNNMVTRNFWDLVKPKKSKTILTQMCLKVLHKVAFDLEITDEEAIELAALQTTHLIPAVMPGRVARSFACWSCLAGPSRYTASRWIRRYKAALKARFPGELNDANTLTTLASASLDAMLQAGGRSVPLALDVVMGYILSKNRPPCLEGVDFKDKDNIRSLMLEGMRFHPPVTMFPHWVRSEDDLDTDEWVHELICLDRACADPTVFENPDEFVFKRPNEEDASMAWAAAATVDGQLDHPNAHACPGRNLSIAMVMAWVLEYHAAGPWELKTDDIKFNYYGSKGWKATKAA